MRQIPEFDLYPLFVRTNYVLLTYMNPLSFEISGKTAIPSPIAYVQR